MSEINLKKSKEIYRLLINGRVINRYSIAADGSPIENPLFTEIYGLYNDYKRQYLMSGMELIARNDFYYVREVDSEMPFTEPVKRIQALLLVTGRHVTQSGALFDKLTHPMGGICDDDLQKIAANEDFSEILAAVDIQDIEKSIKANLLDRGIMEEPRAGRYILSAAGKYFFDELFCETSA